jgi:hypothetical protein
MLRKPYILLLFLMVLGGCCCAHAIDNQEDEVWIISQEMVKFGKKNAYESAKIKMLSLCAEHKKRDDVGMVVCLEETNEPKYIYLHPLKDYKGLDRLMGVYSEMQKSWTANDKALFEVVFPATLNFTLRSLMKYEPSCSYIPNENCSIAQLPWARYMLITVMPGTNSYFEDRLKDIVAKQSSNKSSLCWRTWKLTFGAELPQFVIAFFGTDPVALHEKVEELHVVDGTVKDIVLNQKEGHARYRADLSLTR